MLNPLSIIHYPLSRRGQAVVEYLLVFVALALITVVSLSAFYPKVKATGEKLFTEAMERIAK